MTYTTVHIGSKYTPTYEVFLQRDGEVISPFHDVPLHPDGEPDYVINMVCEIQRFENGKFEISKSDEMNPIKQDTKNGRVRFVQNLFPYKGYLWNYGAAPQTWEDPTCKDERIGVIGDNDPVDLIDIGNVRKNIGDVYKVKVLGCLAMIDSGECDWKILVVDLKDDLSNELNDVEDVEKRLPALVKYGFEWFRDYKMCDGAKRNEFAYNGRLMNRSFAVKVLEDSHLHWKKLMNSGGSYGISLVNSLIDWSKDRRMDKYVVRGEILPPANLPDKLYGFYYP